MLVVALALMANMTQGLVAPSTGQEAPAGSRIAPGAWTATSTLGTVRSLSTATTLDGPPCRAAVPPAWCGKVLATGGRRGGEGVQRSAELYDPRTGYWSPTGSMLSARHSHTATLLDGAPCHRPSPGLAPQWCGKILVAGGAGGAEGLTALESAELYDPESGSWSATGGLAEAGGARFLHSAAALNGPACRGVLGLQMPAWCGKVLVAAGIDPSRSTDVAQGLRSSALYDPATGTWTATGELTTGRVLHTLTAVDGGPCRSPLLPPPPSCGKVLIMGGTRDAANRRTAMADIESYDPALGVWVPAGTLAEPRAAASAVVLDGPACRQVVPLPHCNKILVAGGLTLNQYYIVDTPDVPSAGGRPGVDTPDYGAGANVPPKPTAELYDPITGTSSPTGPMSSGRLGGFTLTVLDGPECSSSAPPRHCGKVLTTGLADSLVTVSGASPEVYDPLAGGFAVTGRQLTAAGGHAALIDGAPCRRSGDSAPPASCGRVLVFGGGHAGFQGFAFGGASAELFDGSAIVQPPTIASINPSAGPDYGGTDVVLSGAGFTGATSVRFGAAEAADYVVESPTRIVATSPISPVGVVNITVHTPNGTSAAINITRFTTFAAAGEWTKTGSRTAAVLRTTVTALADGRVLAVGGNTPPGFVPVAVGEIFDPATGEWGSVPLPGPRRMHTATRLANGKVLVVGGQGPSNTFLGTAVLFDPTTGTWEPTGSLNVGRAEHAATLLRSGKILVVGGYATTNSSNSVSASAEVYDPDKGTWKTVAPLTAGRGDPHAVLLQDGRVLVTSGLTKGGEPFATTEIYDPAEDRWETSGSLNFKRKWHTLTMLGDGRVLVAGGCAALLCGTGQPEPAEIYNPTDGTWRTAGTGRARFDHAAVLIEGPGCGDECGKVLVFGGSADGISPLASADLFDPLDDSWEPALPMTAERRLPAGVLVANGRVLAFGGEASDRAVLRTSELFTPLPSGRTPVVTAVEPPAGPSGTRVRVVGNGLSHTSEVRFGEVAVEPDVVTERVVIARSPAQPRGTVEVTVTTPEGTSVNDPSVRTDDFAHSPGRWRGGPAMSVARYLHTSTLLDGPACRAPFLLEAPPYCGDVLVAGGTKNFIDPPGVGHRSTELYDPHTGTWSATTSDMAAPRFNHTATLLDGPECHSTAPVHLVHCGKVLVVGGEVSITAIATAELYDPLTRTWTPTAPMAQPRFSHTATLLANGRVLVVGGTDSELTRNGLRSAEIYDPLTGTWTPAPTPKFDRHAHTATLLADGRVLVAGGLTRDPDADDGLPGSLIAHNNIIRAEAEVFNPADGEWTNVMPMGIRRFSHSATLVNGPRCGTICGQVLAVGGVHTIADGSGPKTTFHASAELFNPATGTWSPTQFPGTGRGGHTATLLSNGTILVVGSAMLVPSQGDLPSPVAASEVYDPLTRRWTFTDFMSKPRGMQAASLLDGPACRRPAPAAYCGSVVASGGATIGAQPNNTPFLGIPRAPTPTSTSETYASAPDVTALSPPAAPNAGGTPVVLTGAYFAGATAVRFGDTQAASFTVDSPTQITAMTPVTDTVGSVQVTVEGPGGTSALLGGNPAASFLLRGLPGAIATLVARAVSDTAIELNFAAAHNGDGSTPAQDYVIKQSPEEITEANFDAAGAATLCDGKCHIKVPALSYNLRVDDLEPGRTYHYALRAVNDQGRGPLSNDASATTEGIADRLASPCPVLPETGAGAIVYPGGRYSLVGLPGDTVVASDSPLYGWSDLGAGGAYSVLGGSQPVTGGKGYWAWFACPRAVNMSLPAAGGAASASFALGAYHASMVGNPSSTSPATVTGHDFAARWDPGANDGAGGYGISGYREPQSLAVGEGMWTFAYEATRITIVEGQ